MRAKWIGVAAVSLTTVAAGQVLTPVAVTGDVLEQGGELAPGESIAHVRTYVLGDRWSRNARGAFVADLQGDGVTAEQNQAIFNWFWRGGTYYAMIVRKGDAVPDIDGYVFESFGDELHVQGSGCVVFRATIVNPDDLTSSVSSLWIGNGRGVSLIAREGDAAPGFDDGSTLGSFDDSMITSDRQSVAFDAPVGTHGRCAFGFLGNGLYSLAVPGQPIPNRPGVSFGDMAVFGFRDGRVFLNSHGDEADYVLFAPSSASVYLLVGTGDAVDGFDPRDAVLDSLSGIATVSAQRLMFAATLTDGTSGLFEGGVTGPIEPVLIQNAPLPGRLETCVAFDGVQSISDETFICRVRLGGSRVTPANDTAVCLIGPEETTAFVVREGDPAPGGGVFADVLEIPAQFGRVGADEVVFAALVVGVQGTASGLWRWRVDGPIQEIARTGRSVYVRGERKVIDAVYFENTSSGEDGLSPGVSSDGQAVANIRFADGASGLFTIDVNQCPCDTHPDGVVDVEDLFLFLDLWFATHSRRDAAELTGDGIIDFRDLIEFVECWLDATSGLRCG